MFWTKHQSMMNLIQNLSLNFLSFLDLYLNESGSLGGNNRWYRISRSYWVENLQLLFCLFILKAHMSLNGMQRLFWPNGKKMLR